MRGLKLEKSARNAILEGMQKLILIIALFSTVILPTTASAGPIIRTGDKISVDSGQTLVGDFYGFAPSVTISGPAKNDVYLAGGTVTINAPTGEDLTILGGSVQVHGDVGDDLRVVGGDVTIGNTVKGDVVVVGGSLTVLSTAHIEGDILLIAGELVLEGDVAGSVHGTADTARINATIGGDVSITANTLLTFGDKSHVIGNVSYESNTSLARAQNAQFDGEIQKAEMQTKVDSGFIKTFLVYLCMLLFAALSVFLIVRSRLQLLIEESIRIPGRSGLIGLGVLFVTPFIGSIFLVSVLGTPIGILILLIYFAIVVFSVMVSGVLIGYWVEKIFRKKTNITLSTIVLGVSLLAILGWIPFLGGFIILASLLIVLGGVSMTIFRTIRS